jgi:hypothetical protein
MQFGARRFTTTPQYGHFPSHARPQFGQFGALGGTSNPQKGHLTFAFERKIPSKKSPNPSMNSGIWSAPYGALTINAVTIHTTPLLAARTPILIERCPLDILRLMSVILFSYNICHIFYLKRPMNNSFA